MSLASTLHSLLEQSVSPDVSVAQSATQTLKKDHLKNPDTIQALYEILASSTEVNIRNIAAVELRRRILIRDGALWSKVSDQVRQQIKQNILQLAVKDLESSTPTLRTSISRVISAIAVNELDAPSASPSSWAELLPLTYTIASSAQILVGITIINDLLEDAPEVLQAELQTMLSALGSGLSHGSSEVRSASLTGLGRVAEQIDLADKKDVATLESLVPAMVAVLRETMESGDADGRARQAFDDVETIIISETSLVSSHIADLVSFLLAGAENKAYEKIVRVMSLNALTWVIRCHHKSIEKLNLAERVVARLLPIGREDHSDEEEEESPAGLAFKVLDLLSQTLTPAQIFPPLHQQIQADMASIDSAARKSALLALGYTVEGCSEFIRPHVAQLWPIVDAGLQDADATARKAACVALGCLAESLPEDVALRHEMIVPVLFNLVADPATQKAAAAALDSYLEVLGDDITNYMPLLMERLLVLLDSAPLPIRATITGAIGSAAHAADKGFVPYFNETVARIQPFLILQGEGEERALRSVAMDTLGTIGEAVGKDLFRPIVEGVMKSAFEALEMEGEGGKLKESAFMAFGTVAGLTGEEFVPFLLTVMEALVKVCEQGEVDDDAIAAATAQTINTADFPDEDNGSDDDDDFEDIDELEEEDKLEQLLGEQAASATITKEIAADVIGDLFASTGKAFLPYVERSTKVLIGLLDHYYSGLRKSAVTSLFTFIGTFYDLSEPGEWKAGANVSTPLHENVQQLVDVVLPALFARWDQEDDRSVATLFGTELAELMSRCGPAIVQGHFPKIATIASTVLKGESLAQDTDQDDDDDSSAGSDDDTDEEAELVSSAADLVGALATVLGADFSEEYGKTFVPLLAAFYSPDKSSEERQVAIGCLGEIIAGLQSSTAPHTPTVLALILAGLADEDPSIRSNAAFAAGHLAAQAPLSLEETVKLLTALKPLFEAGEGQEAAVGAAKDNACGAVGRMLLRDGEFMNGLGADGLGEVIGMLVGGLPLKNDFIENTPVLSSLVHLFQLSNSNPALQQILTSHIDRLLAEFAYVLEDGREEESESAVREKVKGLVRELAQMEGMGARVEAAGLGKVLV